MPGNLFGQDALCELMGCKRPSDAARLLENQGIKPIQGRPGFWFVTLDQINAARGIVTGQQPEEPTVLI